MKNIFTEHLDNIGETYIEHMKFALYFGFNMLKGGISCIMHAIFPFLFQKTGSRILFKIIKVMINRMPKVTDEVLDLDRIIQKKMGK